MIREDIPLDWYLWLSWKQRCSSRELLRLFILKRLHLNDFNSIRGCLQFCQWQKVNVLTNMFLSLANQSIASVLSIHQVTFGFDFNHLFIFDRLFSVFKSV